MNYRFICLVLTLICIYQGQSIAQNEKLNDDEKYRKEFTYGVNLSTSASTIGGFIFKFANIKDKRSFSTWGFELVNVKHQKESRFPSPITGNSFVFGKTNNLLVFRMQYGRDVILFRKAPEEGVKVTMVIAGGPSLGFEKPYHILYQYANGIVRSEPFDPAKHRFVDAILGSGGFFEGFDKMTFVPGIHAKFGFSLDFGTFRNSITGFEVGVMGELYSREIKLMAFAPNSSFFSAAYLNIFLGNRK